MSEGRRHVSLGKVAAIVAIALGLRELSTWGYDQLTGHAQKIANDKQAYVNSVVALDSIKHMSRRTLRTKENEHRDSADIQFLFRTVKKRPSGQP